MIGFTKAATAAACMIAARAPCGGAVPLPPALARAAADYDRAQVSGDRAALERLLADDYRLVNGAGEIETKAAFVAESVAPGFKLNPYVVTSPIATVWSDGAVLAGEVRLSGRSNGQPFAGHIRFADVWALRRGRWQVVFTQVTRLPAKRDTAP